MESRWGARPCCQLLAHSSSLGGLAHRSSRAPGRRERQPASPKSPARAKLPHSLRSPVDHDCARHWPQGSYGRRDSPSLHGAMAPTMGWKQRPDRVDNPTRFPCRHRPYLPSTAGSSTLPAGELPCGDGRTPRGGPQRRGAPTPNRRGSALAMRRQRDDFRGSALAALRETVVCR
jgi:hypothetical protein